MKTISLFISLLFFVPLASGQKANVNQTMKRNTISISYSPISLEGFHAIERYSPTIIAGKYGFSAVRDNNSSYSGVFLLSYSHRFAPKFELTFDLGYEQQWKDWKIYNNPSRITKKTEHIHYLYFLLYGSVVYFSKNAVEMYSSAGLGAITIWDNVKRLNTGVEPDNKTRFAFHLCLFGIRVKCADWWGFNAGIEAGHIGLVRLGVFARW